ncbi:MAG: hypothetical protein ACI9XO_000927 [Paraglaciecola sp.]|jgi:hypothetical protein
MFLKVELKGEGIKKRQKKSMTAAMLKIELV